MVEGGEDDNKLEALLMRGSVKLQAITLLVGAQSLPDVRKRAPLYWKRRNGQRGQYSRWV